MAKVNLTLTLPTKRADNTAATPADVKGITFRQKAQSAPDSAFSTLGPDVAPTTPVVVFPVNNVSAGKWSFRAVMHDAQDGGPDLVADATFEQGVSPLVGGQLTAVQG